LWIALVTTCDDRLPDLGDGQWAGVTLKVARSPRHPRLGSRLEIANTGANQLLVDNVAATVFGANEIA
jgi:hypothetical protein